MKGIICVPLENRIFVLYHIEKEENNTLEKMNYFIRESNFRMGISRIYNEITKTCYARSQAQIALDFGKEKYPYQWKYEFDEVVFPYLAKCCMYEMPAEYVGSSVFTVLQKEDQKKGAALYQTLIQFVKADFNMVQTAKELFIHRGTLIYRLNKIQEMTNVSWENWQDKMYLAWSVMLIEQEIMM